MKTIQYRGHTITEGEPIEVSMSSAGRKEYKRIVKIDGQHEVWNGIEWELLYAVGRAQQLIDSGKVQIPNP